MARVSLSRPKIITIAAAIVVAVALVATFLVWQSSGLRTAQGVTLITPSDEAVIQHSQGEPLVGEQLSTDPQARIPVSDAPEAHDGALVRISVFEVDTPTTVFGAGTPALTVTAGAGSTTVLLPIVDGGLPIYGDQTAALEVEVLATFASDTNAPGSTITLETPVTRADTTTGLAGETLDSNGVAVGVVGKGGVPATGVRAVYLTVTVETTAATELTIGQQHVPVPEGVSTITTVVSPDAEHGTVPLELAAGEGSLQAHVRGWIPEAPQNMEKHNIAGSFVPANPATTHQVELTGNTPAPVDLAQPADVATTLALVTAQPAQENTTVALDTAQATPQTGAVNDQTHGTLPQLVLATTQQVHAHLGAGATTATVTPVGSWLAESASATDTPAVQIDGPTESTTVELGAEGLLNIHGTLEAPGATIESVVLTVNRRIIGTATLHQQDTTLGWEFTTGVPETGDYQFTVIATDRAGQETTQTVAARVELPPEDDVVIAPQATVLPDTVEVTQLTENTVTFANRPDVTPGDMMISDVTEGAPEGFLRRVAAIDQTASGWEVTTEYAALTDVILQANLSDTADLLAAGEPVIEPVNGNNTVQLVSGEELDITPYSDQGTDTEGTPVETASFGVDTSLSHGIKLEASFATEASGKRTHNLTNSGDEDATELQATIKATGGLAMKAEAQLNLALELGVHITARWHWGIPDVVVEEFRLVAETTAKAEAEGQLTTTLEASAGYNTEFSETLANLHLQPVTFAIGPVPVVITSEVTLDFNSEADIKVKASSTISYSLTTAAEHTKRYGFRYGTMSGIEGINETSSSYQTPAFAREVDEELTGSFEVTFGPELSLDVKIYDVAGPKFAISAQPGVEVELNFSDETLTTAAFVEGEVKGTAEFSVPIIDHVLFDVELFSGKLRYTLKEWQWEYAAAFPAPEQPSIVETSTAWRHSLARTEDGTVYAWGANLMNQLGLGHNQDRIIQPEPVAGLPEIVGLEAGEDRSFAISATGDVYAWGLDYPGGGLGLGQAPGNGMSATTPTQIPGLTNIVDISSSGDSTFAVTNSGDVYAWGYNFNGALGLGDDQPRLTPELIPGLNNIASITTALDSSFAMGGHTTFAVTRDGEVYVWGNSDTGQLGLGSTVSQPVPTRIPGLTNVETVVANNAHITTSTGTAAYAITTNGEVYTWGQNDAGQLGLGNTQDHTSPTKIPELPPVTTLDAAGGSVYAVTQDGEIYAWGANTEGQLGFGDTDNKPSPTPMRGMNNMVWVSTGSHHSVAVKQGGTVYTWGQYYSGGAHDPAVFGPDSTENPIPADHPTPVRVEFPAPEQHTSLRQPATIPEPIDS